MNIPGKTSRGLLLGLGLICATGTAVVVAQRQPTLLPATARDAHELSSVFRKVAANVLPAIVTIKTRGRVVRNNRRGQANPFRNPLFDQLPDELKQQLQGEFGGGEGGERRSPSGEGSGFIIDSNGYVMTNNHVVAGAEEVLVTLHDGRAFRVSQENIATDDRSDLAVLRLDNPPANLKEIRFGDSDKMEIGDWVLAFGAPFGFDLTVTQGIISAKGRGVDGLPKEFLQTDAAINPGNSGGPLLNLNGEVIGINTAISTRSGGYDGIGFAVPSRQAQWAAEQLVQNGVVRHPGLSVGVRDIDADTAKVLRLDSPYGVQLNQVADGGSADSAGLKKGDYLIQLDGKKIRNSHHLQALVDQLRIGQTYEALIDRNGERKRIPVKMQAVDFDDLEQQLSERSEMRLRPERPLDRNEDAGPKLRAEQNGDNAADPIGLRVVETPAAIARNLRLDADAPGVAIASVRRGSPAHSAGVRAGNVIVKVGSKPVNSVAEYELAMRRASLQDGVLLTIQTENGSVLLSIQRG